ncbi:TIM barrel protein [Actinoplanes sp. CA-142083]|uniref:TIM barrel protein n=1 Tax=Actinoplanes sp. CA-142083 TaxID=3239903 RepID=UPI003D92B3E7
MRLSPNIELLFGEAGPDLGDRIRAASKAGFGAVELWSLRDLESVERAVEETGVQVTAALVEYPPKTSFTFPGTDHTAYFEMVDRAVENARRIGCPRLVLASGLGFPGASRQRNLDILAEVFATVVSRTAGSGIGFALEPVNTRVDHPGALLDRTADAVRVARAVGSDRFGILYDLYHSLTEGEDQATELANAGGLVHYVQIADVPGRGEPGSGDVDWALQLGVLRAAGYTGPIGLEYYPTVDSAESVRHIKEVER